MKGIVCLDFLFSLFFGGVALGDLFEGKKL